MCSKFVPFVLIIWLGVAGTMVQAQQPTSGENTAGEAAAPAEDATAAIEAAIQSYLTAFNNRDAEKLAALWAPEGVYISRTSGDQIVGREAMAAEFADMFGSDQVPQLAVATDSIEFISPNVALERGIATVTHAEDDVVETSYSVVYVQQGGEWLIDRVTEDEIFVEYSNADKLAALEWMMGEWENEVDGTTIEINCQWTREQHFISLTYKITSDDGNDSSGLQVIGWDPVNSQIRSWMFDSDGSYVSGTWTESDGKWVVQSKATLADGGQGSFTSVYQPTEDGNVSWKKVNRVLDGELLPSIDEVVIRRK